MMPTFFQNVWALKKNVNTTANHSTQHRLPTTFVIATLIYYPFEGIISKSIEFINNDIISTSKNALTLTRIYHFQDWKQDEQWPKQKLHLTNGLVPQNSLKRHDQGIRNRECNITHLQ